MGDRQSAVLFFNKAAEAANDKSRPIHLNHAYQLFGSAVTADPTFAQGWYQVGNNNADLHKTHAAVANYRMACEYVEELPAEDQAKVLCNLAWQLHQIGRCGEALAVSERAVQLDPNIVYAWVNLSQIHGALGSTSMAVACARDAFELDPKDPTVECALAFALLFDRCYAMGFKHFERRFEWRLHQYLHYPYPKWDGSPGKQLFLVADQGMGDTLSFARFVPAAAARCTYIHACVQPELVRVFQEAFISYPNVNVVPTPMPFQAANCWSTFVSLPSALGLTDDEIRNTPQIPMQSSGVSNQWKATDRKLHIGIAYQGSPLNDIDKHRSIPVTQFLELYRCPGIQLYSLQIDERHKDLHEAGAGALIRDLKPYIRDVSDTIGILRDLDLVITIESALGHIAGSIGKECWIPYSYLGRDYRIGHDGTDILWYPNHRVFHQGPDCRWEPVFDRIVEELKRRVGQ